jgi:hypothetical protein
MPLGYWFWGIYVAAILLGLWANYEATPIGYRRVGAYFFVWLLLGLLGYRIFGHIVGN